MPDVTVKQLAGVLGISSDKLMEQLASAGIPANSEDDGISNESKVKLLEFLRGSHGKDKKSLAPRKKVVLKRKSTEVLRVASGGSGVAKTKSINIEVTYLACNSTSHPFCFRIKVANPSNARFP